MRVIGIGGYSTAGKSEVARILHEQYGLTRISYSDPLYDAALAIDPVVEMTSDDELSEWTDSVEIGMLLLERRLGGSKDNSRAYWRLRDIVRVLGMTEAKRLKDVRNLLQRIGTEAGRNIHGQDCWIRIAEQKMIASNFNCVFENVRFENEAQMVINAGGEIWNVTRPNVGAVNGHISDKGLDAKYITRTIANDGTIEDLAAKVKELVNCIAM